MTGQLQPMAGPRNRWQIGRFSFSRYGRGRWNVDDGCFGAGNCKTPLGALIAQRRAVAAYARMPIEQRIPEG